MKNTSKEYKEEGNEVELQHFSNCSFHLSQEIKLLAVYAKVSIHSRDFLEMIVPNSSYPYGSCEKQKATAHTESSKYQVELF